jgi:hypothetical protein
MLARVSGEFVALEKPKLLVFFSHYALPGSILPAMFAGENQFSRWFDFPAVGSLAWNFPA